MAEIKITQGNIPESAAVRDVFVSAGWGAANEYDLEALRASLQGMTKVYCAYAGHRLVALARILSDGHTVSQLVDIVVMPAYQKQGIGQKLMAAFVKDYNHTAIYVNGLAGNDAFFEACGLKNRAGALVSFSQPPNAV